MTPDEKRRLLAKVPLFAGLGAAELDSLASSTRTRSLPAKCELFHKGHEGAEVYVVARGSLKVLTTSEEGDDVVFTILGPGEVVGEVAFLSGSPRTATVATITPTDLLAIDRRDLLAFPKAHPEASLELLAVLAKRLKRLSELVEDTLFLNLPVRLAKKLVSLAGSHGQPTEGGVRIELRLSQEEWGDLVGATRESVNKQLRSWTEQGLVRLDGGYVVIRRSDELEALAGAVRS
jgi:CRP-like cAMP-binding protein